MWLHTPLPNEAWIIPKLCGVESWHSWCTDLIAAQPAWLQSCENDCTKTACNCMAQPMIEISQPKNEPCSTPSKGHRRHDNAESQSHDRMTWSIDSTSLHARGHMRIIENDYESSPQPWKTLKWSHYRIILMNFSFARNSKYLLHVFPLENVQLK